MKKKILALSGVAVVGMGIATLIIIKRKKRSEIDFLESDDFDDDLGNDDDEMDDPCDLSTHEDVCYLDSLTDGDLEKLADELINEFERRCRAKSDDDKKSQEEAGCRSR